MRSNSLTRARCALPRNPWLRTFTVAVTDTGPGIPPEELKRVFKQFHQIDNSNTKAEGGTGLGLAIAKQIVEMHGGRIWVKSTLGRGATFQMELPLRAAVGKGAT
jgi:signal transduction histidine kinase